MKSAPAAIISLSNGASHRHKGRCRFGDGPHPQRSSTNFLSLFAFESGSLGYSNLLVLITWRTHTIQSVLPTLDNCIRLLLIRSTLMGLPRLLLMASIKIPDPQSSDTGIFLVSHSRLAASVRSLTIKSTHGPVNDGVSLPPLLPVSQRSLPDSLVPPYPYTYHARSRSPA